MIFSRLLRIFFRLLYHQFAFAYDLVASVVSFARWNEWILTVLPFVEGKRILELGHGPGYLQLGLRKKYSTVIGIDESRQMGRLAMDRLNKEEYRSAPCLVRSLSQALPFPSGSFDCLVSTFPSEYITDPHTLSEVSRVLLPGGRLVVLPAAWPRNPLLAWLYRVTGETPTGALEVVKERLLAPFQNSGLKPEIHTVQIHSGVVMILIARLENGIAGNISRDHN